MFMTIRNLVLAVSIFTTPSLFAQSTEEVWQHHIQAWEARDLDSIMSDYNAETIFIVNNKVYEGIAAIRNVFSRLFEIFDAGQNRIDTPQIRDRVIYLQWHFTPTGDREFYGSDTFVIENGKITVQTIASELYERQ